MSVQIASMQNVIFKEWPKREEGEGTADDLYYMKSVVEGNKDKEIFDDENSEDDM